ncbi:MAG: xanthine dehydrogenase family protein subunit M [Deltaproteobacteria bacterium]|nr:xanthine dehydrogenase family protein subunit M [Deltaproteobacteria bacterium]
MILPKFDYHEPTTLAEACQIMAELGPKAKPIAGGTDLIVNMKKKVLSPEHLVSVSRIEELKKLDTANGQIQIGACFTVAELAESERINQKLSALASGAHSLGSPLVRNLATIGGNLGSARPAADLPPSLIAYGAKVILKSNTGERAVSLDDFFVGPGFTEIGPDEILTEIRVDSPPALAGAGYINLGIRKAQDCNIVNVASYISLSDPESTIQTARIVMGCVGPIPLRATSAEKMLAGEKPSETLFMKAGEAAMEDCAPIDDFRGSAEYKKAMVSVLTKKTLGIAYSEARNRPS